jgi:hypothetical protein
LKSCSSFLGKNFVKNHLTHWAGLNCVYVTYPDAASDDDCAITIASLVTKLDIPIYNRVAKKK